MTTSASTLDLPALGEGVYTFAEASRILTGIGREVTTRQLRYWVETGLTSASRTDAEGNAVLTFDDLISLEIVRRFRVAGTSLQSVRRVEQALRASYPHLHRPFAYKVFFTDGATVWAQELDEEGPIAVELHGRHREQRVWIDAIQTFATEIRYDEDLHASSWLLDSWVEIDPQVQFGAPVVKGTRVPVHTVVANLRAGTPEDVASWYGLTVEQVLGARDFVAAR